MEINSFCLGVITAAPPDRFCPISQFTAWQQEAKKGSPFCPRQEESLPRRCPQEGISVPRWQPVPRDGAWSCALRTLRHGVIHVFTCPSSSLCSTSLSFAPYGLQPGKLFLCLAHGASFHSRRPPSGCVAAHKNPRGAIRIAEGAAWKAQLRGALPSPLPFPPGVMHAAGAASCPSRLCPRGKASWGGSSLCGVRVRGEHRARAVCWKEP